MIPDTFSLNFLRPKFSIERSVSRDCPKLNSPIFDQFVETADICLGWFWGPDLAFSNIEGVLDVVVGYAGGKEIGPTYRNILDHTEAVRVQFDPTRITYRDILRIFFMEHSPFAPEYSRQYRSALLVHNDDQREVANEMVSALAKKTGRLVYTKVEDATDFYRAEEYHQKYFEKQSS